MIEELFACLDGSALAERILPLVRDITASKRARISLLNHFKIMSIQESY